MPNTTTCQIEGCYRGHSARGWCHQHYLRWRRWGDPLAPPQPKGRQKTSLIRDVAGQKRCACCKKWQPEGNFHQARKNSDGLASSCKSCEHERRKARAEAHRDWKRYVNFGLTREQFDLLFAQQDGRCAICRTDDPGTRFWCVDHDHSCCGDGGKSCGRCIRGILCQRCNRVLGLAQDSIERLSRSIEYLQRQRWERGLEP